MTDEVLMLFAESLAKRLGKDKNEIIKKGLSASDFLLGRSLQITWSDDSVAKFEHAFSVYDPSIRKIGVFTEHCGYFSIEETGVKCVEEICRECVYYADDK